MGVLGIESYNTGNEYRVSVLLTKRHHFLHPIVLPTIYNSQLEMGIMQNERVALGVSRMLSNKMSKLHPHPHIVFCPVVVLFLFVTVNCTLLVNWAANCAIMLVKHWTLSMPCINKNRI